MIQESRMPLALDSRLRTSPGNVISCDAGWSSSVARWAHNPEVVGSNPAPATDRKAPDQDSSRSGAFRFAPGHCANARLLEVRRDPGLHRRPNPLSVALTAVRRGESLIRDIELSKPGVRVALGNPASPLLCHPAVMFGDERLEARTRGVLPRDRSVAERRVDIAAALIVVAAARPRSCGRGASRCVPTPGRPIARALQLRAASCHCR